MMAILNVRDVEKYYGNKKNVTKALKGISFEVEEGEFVSIMGASGSGKTTLLNCISTIDKITTGKIILENEDI
ncbi:MAG: ATP-binding cassette domain-containing protein, partial [Clostridium sp.]